MSGVLFELHLLGGATERRYRRSRPEIESLPWGTIEVDRLPTHVVAAARQAWTLSAFQEHRTAAACAETLVALTAAQAPVDLVAMATSFPLDEIVHVELCGRLATELGGCAPLFYEPARLLPPATPDLPPLVHAAELVTRYFCVGEAISVPLLRATWRAATHPLVRGVLARIVKDEAAHGRFGWLSWIGPFPSATPRHAATWVRSPARRSRSSRHPGPKWRVRARRPMRSHQHWDGFNRTSTWHTPARHFPGTSSSRCKRAESASRLIPHGRPAGAGSTSSGTNA